jgi:hypothetical protein
MGIPHAGDLFVCLGNYPEPADADHTADTNPLAARLLANWRTHMPAHPDNGHGDVEDFWEMAARLTAALDAGTFRVWLYCSREDPRLLVDGHPTSERLDLRVAEQAIADGLMPCYGPLNVVSGLWRVIDNRADAYHSAAAFTDHAGRATAVCGFIPEPTPQTPSAARVEQVLAQFARDGHDEVLVKAVRAKHGIWRVPTSTDEHANEAALMQALGWSLIGVEGSPNTLLVQQIVDMRFEYRIFVVDGEPVTGAGCVEEHTPLHSVAGEPFAALVRERRAAPTDGPLVARPDLVDQYRELARTVAQQALREGSMPRGYVIDCAVIDGQPVVIEMNGMTNAGLYASQPWLVTRALMSTVTGDMAAGQPNGRRV